MDDANGRGDVLYAKISVEVTLLTRDSSLLRGEKSCVEAEYLETKLIIFFLLVGETNSDVPHQHSLRLFAARQEQLQVKDVQKCAR